MALFHLTWIDYMVALLIDYETPILLKGDVFTMDESDYLALIGYPSGNVISRKQVECIVENVYVKSSYEILYLCKGDKHFTMRHILKPLYKVRVTHPTKYVSHMIMIKAAEMVGSIMHRDDGLFLLEDAYRVKDCIDNMELEERYGWLRPIT